MEVSIERVCVFGTNTSDYSRWKALKVIGICIEDGNGGLLSRGFLRLSRIQKAHVDKSLKDETNFPDWYGRAQ